MQIHKIGIIGAGNIGGTFARHFAKVGQSVQLSSRHPEQLEVLASDIGATVGSLEVTAQFGDVLLFAPPYLAYLQLAQQLGALTGKILIDAANPYPNRDGALAQRVLDDPEQTASGYVASLFPESKVVKAFNATYFKEFESRAFLEGDDRLAIPIASDHADAKLIVRQLIEAIGMAPVDYGALVNGARFEPGTPPYNVNLSLADFRRRFPMV